MAQNKSLIRLKGSIGGMSFYEQNGNNLVKMATGPDKDKIMSDPAYKRTRENMSEFGGSAKVGKALRKAFAEVIKNMGETYITGRITGLMKQINSLGAGNRGERTFEILNNNFSKTF